MNRYFKSFVFAIVSCFGLFLAPSFSSKASSLPPLTRIGFGSPAGTNYTSNVGATYFTFIDSHSYNSVPVSSGEISVNNGLHTYTYYSTAGTGTINEYMGVYNNRYTNRIRLSPLFFMYFDSSNTGSTPLHMRITYSFTLPTDSNYMIVVPDDAFLSYINGTYYIGFEADVTLGPNQTYIQFGRGAIDVYFVSSNTVTPLTVTFTSLGVSDFSLSPFYNDVNQYSSPSGFDSENQTISQNIDSINQFETSQFQNLNTSFTQTGIETMTMAELTSGFALVALVNNFIFNNSGPEYRTFLYALLALGVIAIVLSVVGRVSKGFKGG